MPDAFYVADGDSFVSTEWTRGPWDARAQHAGPPAALVGRAFERLEPREFQVVRFTTEILKPIPIARLHIDAQPVRTGRRVQYATATVTSDGVEIARASAWRIRTSDEPTPATPVEAPPFAGPMPLVEGEPISPLSRVLSAADSGNGISAELDFRTDLFINTDLTVHLFRMPEGEWVCIDAQTRQDANGIGVAQSVIWDEHRRIGAGAQALLIGSR
ncbi:MAG: thioesterase family protein [Actinobacteria bacterium]|nr:MAG: thioesterase family protein [Actinomycetota bacterium]